MIMRIIISINIIITEVEITVLLSVKFHLLCDFQW